MVEAAIGIVLGLILGAILLKQRKDIRLLQERVVSMHADIEWKASSTRLQTIEAKVWDHERYVTAFCNYLGVTGVQEPTKFVLKDR